MLVVLIRIKAGAQLGIFKGMGLINKKGHTEYFLNIMFLEIIFFKFGNKRNRTGSFRISLPSRGTSITNSST